MLENATGIAPTHTSVGFGDTLAKCIQFTGLAVLGEVYENLSGKPCGCEERRQKLNELFPYKQEN